MILMSLGFPSSNLDLENHWLRNPKYYWFTLSQPQFAKGCWSWASWIQNRRGCRHRRQTPFQLKQVFSLLIFFFQTPKRVKLIGFKNLLKHVFRLKVDRLLQAFSAETKVFQCLECKLPQDLFVVTMISGHDRSKLAEKARVGLKHCYLPICSRFWTKDTFWEPEHKTNYRQIANTWTASSNLPYSDHIYLRTFTSYPTAPWMMFREATTTKLFLVKELPKNKKL